MPATPPSRRTPSQPSTRSVLDGRTRTRKPGINLPLIVGGGVVLTLLLVGAAWWLSPAESVSDRRAAKRSGEKKKRNRKTKNRGSADQSPQKTEARKRPQPKSTSKPATNDEHPKAPPGLPKKPPLPTEKDRKSSDDPPEPPGERTWIPRKSVTARERDAFRKWAFGDPSETFRFANDITLSHDGQLLAAQAMTHVYVWRVKDGRTLLKSPIDEKLRRLMFTRDGAWLAARHHDGKIGVWDVASGKKVFDLTPKKGGVETFGIDRDRNLIVGGGEHGYVAWRANDPKPHDVIERGTRGLSFVQQVVFHPDGKRLITCEGNRPMMIWDLATGKKVDEISPNEYSSRNFAEWGQPPVLSPDGRQFVIAEIGESFHCFEHHFIVDFRSHRLIAKCGDDKDRFRNPSYSHGGRFIVAQNVKGAGVPVVIDAKSGKVLYTSFSGPVVPPRYRTMRVTADGKRIVAATFYDKRPGVIEWEFPAKLR